jgi:glycosyltransferase involved in cell wall biosynthesis
MLLKIAAREPLSIDGDPDADIDSAYYGDAIKLLLNEPGIELIGEVDDRDKDDFLGNAAALLFPIRWPEPFGLVMIEALACGTPVVALRAGSVPEVISPGSTGYICESEDDLTRGIQQLDSINRCACRTEVERWFSVAAMADGYEQVYRQLPHAEPRRG